ncbi:MAG: GNAT family N-acetyltransferase [Paludibacter sp.]|nr:GNAT family N-acetyltransferase [Paludibacter sp.]
MKDIEIKQISLNSEDYRQETDLRNKVLRKPLNMNLYDEDLSDEKDQIHFAAFSKGKVIGTLILVPQSLEIIKMRQVAVDFSFQNMGVGQNLIVFSEKYAREHSFSKIELHARKVASGFYKHMGYQIAGDEFFEINIPHFKMYKNL